MASALCHPPVLAAGGCVRRPARQGVHGRGPSPAPPRSRQHRREGRGCPGCSGAGSHAVTAGRPHPQPAAANHAGAWLSAGKRGCGSPGARVGIGRASAGERGRGSPRAVIGTGGGSPRGRACWNLDRAGSTTSLSSDRSASRTLSTAASSRSLLSACARRRRPPERRPPRSQPLGRPAPAPASQGASCRAPPAPPPALQALHSAPRRLPRTGGARGTQTQTLRTQTLRGAGMLRGVWREAPTLPAASIRTGGARTARRPAPGRPRPPQHRCTPAWQGRWAGRTLPHTSMQSTAVCRSLSQSTAVYRSLRIQSAAHTGACLHGEVVPLRQRDPAPAR